MVERRRGEHSPLKPYLDAMPRTFHTPLFYTPQQLEGLRGTNLHAAVTAQRRQLAAVLERHVQPAANKLLLHLKKNAGKGSNEQADGDVTVAAAAAQKKRGGWFGGLFGGGRA